MDFLRGGGEMGALIRAHDWAGTTLGAPEQWPSSLRTAVRLMLNTGHPMYIFWGHDGNCLYNDAYRASIGAERHPASLGRPAREVWEEIWDVIGPQIEQVMAGRGATFHEHQLIPITRDGVKDDVYWTYSYGPIDDSSSPSGVGGVLVVCTETTVLNTLAQQLSIAEERLQLALAAGRGIGTWDWDIPNDRVIANERFARLYGVDAERAKAGAPIAEFFTFMHPDDVDRVRASIAKALATGELLSEEYRLQRADGDSCWVMAEGRCIFSADGKPVRFPGVSFDISDRKAAEKRLADLNADLERQVIERSQARGVTWQVSPDLMGALNSKGYFETSNPAWQSVLGWSEEEVASMSIFELLHPDDVEPTRAGFELTQIGQPAIQFPNRYRCKNGEYRWISWVGVPEGGMVYCAGRDITEERRQADALAETQAALRQSQKMEAVGQLTGGLAHDFNNLLAAISGSMQVIKAKVARRDYVDLERFADMGEKSVRRAAALTQRLLAFSRRQTLDPRPVNVNRLVSGMEDLIRRSVGPEVRLEVVSSSDLWITRVDPSQLENVLLNLCINARDAMLPAGGRLTIETSNQALDERTAAAQGVSPGDYIALTVSDTGTGIPSDVLAHIFDPFFTTKPLGQGTGLGLSMVYGFARQSGGNVHVDTEVGQGTSMSLYLPRHAGEAESAADAAQNDAFATGEGETVAVIEDEDAVRDLVAEVLGGAGYRVLSAVDGPSGLRLLQSDKRIDLVVTDVGLPGGLNGRQVVDAARLLRPDLKVLFLTGFAGSAAVDRDLVETGMQLMIKPFDVAALANKVREMLGTGRA